MKKIDKSEMSKELVECRFLTIVEGMIEGKHVRCYLHENTDGTWFSNVVDTSDHGHLMSISTEALYEDSERPVIGDIVEIRFPGLSQGSTLKGRVDTGATTCSLHVDDADILDGEERVQFKNNQLSDSSFTVPLAGKQEVSSADNGSETRPMVKLDVNIDGKVIEDVEFNLNDRSNMDHPILVGQNLLESGNFMIDPKINETKFLSELALMFPDDTIRDIANANHPVAVQDVPEEIPQENMPAEQRSELDMMNLTLTLFNTDGSGIVYKLKPPTEVNPEHSADFDADEKLDYITARMRVIKDELRRTLTMIEELDEHWGQKKEPEKKDNKKEAPKKTEPKKAEKKDDKKEEKKKDGDK